MKDRQIKRKIQIEARPETVFNFFMDSKRFAKWWGEGSSIEPEVGGKVIIRYPNGETASGTVLEILKPRKIVFTYGYDSPGKPIPPGGSRVTVELTEERGGTLLSFLHEVDSREIRDLHIPGWRYQLAVFGRIVAEEEHADVEKVVDRYFAAWGEADVSALRNLLKASVVEDVEFRDAFGIATDLEDLMGHIQSARLHMGTAKLERIGSVRQSHGMALVDWKVVGGKFPMTGSNVFELNAGGLIRRVTGFPGNQ